MRPLARYALVGMAVPFAACLLLWEAGQPVTVVQLMLVLGRFDLRACAIVAPLAFGAVMTAVGVVMGVLSSQRGKPTTTLAWFIIADLVAPTVALGGHSVAVVLLGVRAV